MVSKTTKVRFVYCPRCQKLLTEFSNIPFYKCGGCGTILKAKGHSDDAESRTSKTLEEKAGHDSEDNDSISLSKQAIIYLPDAYMSNMDSEGKLNNEFTDHDKNLKCRSISNPNALASTGDLNYRGKKDKLESGVNGDKHGRSSNIRSSWPDDQLTFKGRSSVQMQPNHNIQSKSDNSLDKQEEVSQQLLQYASDEIRSYPSKMEEKTSFTGHKTTSDEAMADPKLGFSNRGLSKRTLFKPQRSEGSADTKGRPTRDDIFLNNEMGADLGTRSQERKLMVMSLEEHSVYPNPHEPLKTARYGHQELEEGNRHDPEVFRAVQKWMESQMDRPCRFPSGNQGYRRGPPNAYGTEIPSTNRHEEHVCTTNSYASRNIKELQLDREKLLRKVEELRDQLSRSCKVRGNEKEEQQLVCCSNDSQENLLQLSDTWHPPGIYGPRKTISQHYGPSHITSSERTTNCRHFVDYSLNCYPGDSHFSTHFQPTICDSQGLCMSSSAHTCYCPFNPSPASPQPQMDYEMVKHQKEKRQLLKRHCRPIAGAAPFVVCYSCCKLLQLPADFLLSRGKRHKLKCGACSQVLIFSFLNNARIFPYNPTQEPCPPIEVNKTTDVAAKNVTSSSDTDGCPQGVTTYSDDYGISIPKSYSSEGECTLLAPPFRVSCSNPVDKEHTSNDSSEQIVEITKSFSEQSGNESKKELPKSVSPSSDGVRSEQTSSEANVTARTLGSPLHRLMGYSSPSEMINGSHHRVKRFENLDYEALADSQSSPEYHREINKEDAMLKRSYNTLPVPVNNGMEELNHVLESMKERVSVNGRVIPDQLVKKAEEKAGPIQPGNYWYDSRAGFWGVMDQPCLGIIPPFIEEFNYPMRKDCAGGNTGIFVNGRELHQKDLNLLSCRGLPTTKNRAYDIETGGRVIDKESGEELDSLGKLAPTAQDKQATHASVALVCRIHDDYVSACPICKTQDGHS